MTHHDDHFRDPDLGPVIDRLRAERPTASALELDAIKQRARTRVARSRRTAPMRSRLAIIATLALGGVLTTGGAGLAVSGLASSSQNAAISQYAVSSPTPGGNGVLGEQGAGVSPEGGGVSPEGGPSSPSGGPNSGTLGEEETAQPARQVEAGAQGSPGNQQLPFTGFAAIPVLLGGVALLGTGLVLRRRTGDNA